MYHEQDRDVIALKDEDKRSTLSRSKNVEVGQGTGEFSEVQPWSSIFVYQSSINSYMVSCLWGGDPVGGKGKRYTWYVMVEEQL